MLQSARRAIPRALGLYTDTINLIRTHAMGADVARALGSGRGALLKNHGVVVTGASIEETVIGAIMLENGAKVQLLAEAAGGWRRNFRATTSKSLSTTSVRPSSSRSISIIWRGGAAPGK